MTTRSALDALADQAATQGASDVHLDLNDDAVRVRMRIDGRLRGWVPGKLNVDTLRRAAWQVAQSGTARIADWHVAAHADGRELALRLSAGRSDTSGEPMIALGMSPGQAGLIARALDRAGGVVLVGGPARSGRSMTIAALTAGEARSRSVVSIGLPMAHSIHVDPDRYGGMTAAAQRALALDPDTLVFADLPDAAAASRAFQIAATGRRVIARIDAADAVAVIDRLRALRIDRLSLAAQLRAVTAQRTATRLCPACRRPAQATNAVAALLGFDPGTVIYESAGCAQCDGTGVDRRIGVFEAIVVDSEVARLVNDGADAALLTRHAFLNAPRLGSAARAMVREGVIGAEEAIRLSRDAAGTPSAASRVRERPALAARA